MTDPGIHAPQPWTREDDRKLPPDRAFFRELFERYLDEEAKREERFNEKLDRMPTRWFWVWALWSLVIGVVLALIMAIFRAG